MIIMPTKDIILNCLKNSKNTIISLNQIESILTGRESYLELATIIHDLMDNAILKPVKEHGMNGKTITLYNTYRIIKSNLRKEINNEIQRKTIIFHPHINLDIYFSLHEREWKNDLLYIEKIDSYLKIKGLPHDYATSPERSLQIIGDEKWIDEKEGRRILERIKLWDKLKIITNPDPLMFAINPARFHKKSHINLIVENKTPFYNLINHIKDSKFTSLIYGAGWRIIANISSLSSQLGLEEDLHKIYYFGDMDPEGISIWYSLYEKHNIKLALPFYRALLIKQPFKGKENQEKNIKAIEEFKKYFTDDEILKIDALLNNGEYLPQEALRKEELVNIWRQEKWKFL